MGDAGRRQPPTEKELFAIAKSRTLVVQWNLLAVSGFAGVWEETCGITGRAARQADGTSRWPQQKTIVAATALIDSSKYSLFNIFHRLGPSHALNYVLYL